MKLLLSAVTTCACLAAFGTSTAAAIALPFNVTDAKFAATWGWALVSTVLYDLQYYNPQSKSIIENSFIHQRYLSNYSSAVIVTPNYDTLYSPAVLNLRDGPLILHLPDTAGRYYVIPFHDLQANAFALVGSLTTGTQAGYVYITGPNSFVPELDTLNAIHEAAGLAPFVSVIKAPGYDAFNIGRIRSEGPEDTLIVNDLQDQFHYKSFVDHFGQDMLPSFVNKVLHKRSASRRDLSMFFPKIPPKIPVYTQAVGAKYAEAIPASVFWEALSSAVIAYPPTNPNDTALFAGWAQYGLSLTQQLVWENLTSTQQQELTAAVPASLALQNALGPVVTTSINNGWIYSPKDTAKFAPTIAGDVARAITAHKFYGALPYSETIYYNRAKDDNGKPLVSVNNYVLTMPALPDVSGFWSVTAYNASSFFFFNTDKYIVGDHTPGLQLNADNSLSIFLGVNPPPSNLNISEANWLPVGPQSGFYLIIRTYGPGASVSDQSWVAPNITLVV